MGLGLIGFGFRSWFSRNTCQYLNYSPDRLKNY